MVKSHNYSEEDTQKLLELYAELGNEHIEEIAEQMNRSVNSIRAKLVREKVYVVPEKPARIRKNGQSKKEILRDLEELGLPMQGLDGLQGATKAGLNCIKDFILEMRKHE